MKLLRAVMVGLILAVLPAALAFSQGDAINSEELEPHERPLVQFNHDRHGEIIECLACHHDYQVYGNDQGGEGTRCSECHKKEPGSKVPVDLRTAFHKNCKGCHANWLEWGRQTGPITCGECHKRGS
ncbi:MAG: cytochrome c3 family protein [Thermodesulfobacteriota bacterium]